MNNLLSIDSVSKYYGNFTALNNVSLNVKEGSIFGLLGPNGAGKTTLIRIINQITRPDEGKILFNNEFALSSFISSFFSSSTGEMQKLYFFEP